MEQRPFSFHSKTIRHRRESKHNCEKNLIVLKTYLVSWHQHRKGKLRNGRMNRVYCQIKYWSFVSSLHVDDTFSWTMSWPTYIWSQEAYKTLNELRAAFPYFQGRVILNKKTRRKNRALRCLPSDPAIDRKCFSSFLRRTYSPGTGTGTGTGTGGYGNRCLVRSGTIS